MNKPLRSTAFLLACLAAAARADTIGTPDGRIRATVTSSFDPSTSSGSVGVSGNVGAYGFDNSLEGGPSGGRITNVPFYASIGSDGARYEETFGPRVANATIGCGRITEGVDVLGRITVLGWPGPGMYDQVDFVSVTRGYPNAGAPVNAGSFAGFGSSWLTREFGWASASQTYASDESETLVTVLDNPSRAMRVTITDVVDPVEDLVARNFRFECMAGGSCALPATLAYYADMNPTTGGVPRLPSVTDAAADDFSDFGSVYDSADSAMIHFRPYQVDPVALSILATSHPDTTTALDAVAGAFGPGVYVAVAGQSSAAEFQAGFNSGGLVRSEAEGTALLDPYYDLADDGHLSGSTAAFGKTAGALAGLAPDADGSFSVYLVAADEPGKAIALIAAARRRGFDKIRRRSERDWGRWISRARLPATSDPQTLAVARHALMLIRTAQDRKSGAIVANATTQTPYRQDWVRDGSFFNYALLLAGYPEMALRHADFYRRIYRAGGTWDSCYYTDGAEGCFVYPYEIDSQALAVWALWLPFEFDPTRLEYLRDVYPAIRDTANALLLCRDPTNGLQCQAAEDDSLVPSQGAQGAATVYLALRDAARAADTLGDAASRDRWNGRADELQQAAITKLCGPSQCQGGRGGVYLVWPSRLVDPAGTLAQSHMTQYAMELDRESSFSDPAIGGYLQYPMEPLLALGPFWNPPNRDREQALGGWVGWLTHDVAEPGVLHYGERIFRCDGQSPCDPGRRYLHTIGFPHIWSGAETYIAAAFVHGLSGPGCSPGATIGAAACR